MTDRQLLALIPSKSYTLPSVISRKAGARRINAQLGRLHRSGLVERVPGPRCYLYRSMQEALL